MKRLPQSELELMMIIWNAGHPVTRMEIEANLDPERKILPNTILSFLSRLEEKGVLEKGFVKVEKKGKINWYTPIVEEKKYLQAESKSILATLYGNSMKNFVTALYDGKAVNQEQIRELKEFLDELDRK